MQCAVQDFFSETDSVLSFFILVSKARRAGSITMSEERAPFSTVQLIKGLGLGLLIGGLCLGVDFFLGMVLSSTHLMFLNALVTIAILFAIGAIFLKKSRDTGFRRGILIALSLAAIIATACGVAMGTGPLRFN